MDDQEEHLNYEEIDLNDSGESSNTKNRKNNNERDNRRGLNVNRLVANTDCNGNRKTQARFFLSLIKTLISLTKYLF